MADIFDVIADGTRREILQFLRVREDVAEGGTSVGQIVEELALSQPTVSKHLKILRDAELVSVREEGQRRLYSLAAGPLVEVEDWLLPFLENEYDGEYDGDESAEGIFDFSDTPLPESAAHAAEVLGRAAASATHAVTAAWKRLGGERAASE